MRMPKVGFVIDIAWRLRKLPCQRDSVNGELLAS